MNTTRNLNAAIRAKNLERVARILSEGVKPDELSCFLAIERRAYPILRALVRAGADVNGLEPYWNRTPLVKAIKLQDEIALGILLGGGASPNLKCSGGPPLFVAANKGWVDGARKLIENGANLEQLNCSENTPLMIASRMGHLPLVKLLIDRGANPLAVDMLDRTAYEIALEGRREEIAEYLAPLSSGKVPREKSALELLLDAIKNRDRPAFEKHLAECGDLNAQDKFGRSPLNQAIGVGSSEFVKRLIESGADMNLADEDRTSPLDYAITRVDPTIVEILLKAGARPHSGYPLFSACGVGNLRMFQILLDAGYEINERSPEGLMPLMMASRALSPEIVRILIEKGAEVDGSDKNGWTALFNAVAASSVTFSELQYENGPKVMWAEIQPSLNENEKAHEAVKLLLSNGADVNHRNKEGRTPITYACSPGMVDLLIQAGARLDIRDKRGHDAQYWLRRNGIRLDASSRAGSVNVTELSPKRSTRKPSKKRRRL